ncbi:MAG: hypothetical protein ACYTAF_11400, partial [Planctomycetota bacterium]
MFRDRKKAASRRGKRSRRPRPPKGEGAGVAVRSAKEGIALPESAVNGRMKVVILARKRLGRNTRVVRQAQALSRAGHDVTVVAMQLPSPALRELTPDVRYIEVAINPWPARLLRRVSRLQSLPGRLWRQTRMRARNRWKRIARGMRGAWKGLIDFTGRLLGWCGIGLRWSVVSLFRLLRLVFKVVFWLPGKLLRLLRPLLRFLPVPFFRGNVKAAPGGSRLVAYLRRLVIPYMSTAITSDFTRKADRALEGEQFDLCQAHDSFSLPAAARIAGRSGGEIVYDALEMPEDRSGAALEGTPKWLKRRQMKQDEGVVRSSRLVLSVGPSLAEWTRERYGLDEVKVVSNCKFYGRPRPNRRIKRDLGLGRNAMLALSIGAIYRDQGVEQLMDAAKHLPRKIHVACLGPEGQRGFLDEMRWRIEQVGVKGRFHLVEPVPPEELLSYAAGADLGVIARQDNLANNKYSLPNKVFEMVMSELPVAVGGLPDIEELVLRYAMGAV